MRTQSPYSHDTFAKSDTRDRERQDLLAQLGANLSEFFALAVGQLHATVDLVAQDTILNYQIVMVRPQVIVRQLGDGFQQVFSSSSLISPLQGCLLWL
jgi:hypothetical protein